MEAAVNHDAVGTPECILELLEAGQVGMRTLHPLLLNGELLTPHRPPLIKDGMGAKATDPARQTILNGKLQMMARIPLVRTGEFQSEMLARLSQGLRRIVFGGPEVIHPEDPFLTLLEGSRGTVGGSREVFPHEVGNRGDLERFPVG